MASGPNETEREDWFSTVIDTVFTLPKKIEIEDHKRAEATLRAVGYIAAVVVAIVAVLAYFLIEFFRVLTTPAPRQAVAPAPPPRNPLSQPLAPLPFEPQPMPRRNKRQTELFPKLKEWYQWEAPKAVQAKRSKKWKDLYTLPKVRWKVP